MFTDGFFMAGKLGYSFGFFSHRNCEFPLFEFKGLLTPRKTILGAGAAAQALPHTGSIYLISDCRSSFCIFSNYPSPCPLSYLYTTLDCLVTATRRPIITAWIKGQRSLITQPRMDETKYKSTKTNFCCHSSGVRNTNGRPYPRRSFLQRSSLLTQLWRRFTNGTANCECPYRLVTHSISGYS